MKFLLITTFILSTLVSAIFAGQRVLTPEEKKISKDVFCCYLLHEDYIQCYEKLGYLSDENHEILNFWGKSFWGQSCEQIINVCRHRLHAEVLSCRFPTEGPPKYSLHHAGGLGDAIDNVESLGVDSFVFDDAEVSDVGAEGSFASGEELGDNEDEVVADVEPEHEEGSLEDSGSDDVESEGQEELSDDVESDRDEELSDVSSDSDASDVSDDVDSDSVEHDSDELESDSDEEASDDSGVEGNGFSDEASDGEGEVSDGVDSDSVEHDSDELDSDEGDLGSDDVESDIEEHDSDELDSDESIADDLESQPSNDVVSACLAGC